MASCIRCGATLEDFDVGGDMVCHNCESRAGAAGSGTDVPCQRCGMYLPPHELRMWNSRLYCAYCIMDIQDEEKYGKERHAATSAQVHHQERAPIDLGGHTKYGSCSRCGRESRQLYTVMGMQVCQNCYTEGGEPSAGGGKPSRFAQLVSSVKKKFSPAKKIIAASQPAPAPSQVFDLKKRKMVDRKTGVDAAAPLSEEKREEKKKPKPGLQKLFSAFKKKSE